MAAVAYDPSVVEEFARRLYARARLITALYTVLGVLVVPLIVAAIMAGNGADLGFAEVILAAIAGGVVGFVVGRERAFSLRLQAQIALCQVQIERNSRSQNSTAAAA